MLPPSVTRRPKGSRPNLLRRSNTLAFESACPPVAEPHWQEPAASQNGVDDELFQHPLAGQEERWKHHRPSHARCLGKRYRRCKSARAVILITPEGHTRPVGIGQEARMLAWLNCL